MSVIDLYEDAINIFMAGVRAADPYDALQNALKDDLPSEAVQQNTILISVGKAAVKMAQAAMDLMPAIAQAVVVTNYENMQGIAGAQVFDAGHPVPDQNGETAAKAIIELLEKAGQDQQVLCLVSGGASALIPAPVSGISLADKAEVNKVLLGCGADIGVMNLVRQNLSQLKGGGLVRIAYPARVRGLILSDVIGDDPRIIASGPTAQKLGNKVAARAVLDDFGVWDMMPKSVQAHLEKQEPAPFVFEPDNRIIGSNGQSVRAMKRAFPDAFVYQPPIIGDVQKAAEEILTVVRNSDEKLILFGGETTVNLTGNGLGGRNQELALRVALLLEQSGQTGEWVFLSGGTDGRDGPCDAAGGVVDSGTLKKARDIGLDVAAMLANNDSYHILKSVDGLLKIGATGTNVADLQVFIRR